MVWVVRMIRTTSGLCVIYIRNGVDNKSITMCEKENGRCGLQGLMGHDELEDMGQFVPMKKKI